MYNHIKLDKIQKNVYNNIIKSQSMLLSKSYVHYKNLSLKNKLKICSL